MTDDELLQLIQTKSPDELSADEIGHLRRRITESDALRETLFCQLQMEGYLAAALSRVNIQPEQIVARAQRESAGRQSLALWLGALLAVPLLALIGVVLFQAIRNSTTEVALAKPAPGEKKTPAPAEDSNPAPNPKTGVIAPTNATPQPAAVAAVVPPLTPTPPPTRPANPPPAAAPPTPSPWQDVLAVEGPKLPKLAEEAFVDFAITKQLPRRTDLQRWFEAVPGANHRIVEVDTPRGRCAALEGTARLKSPWTADSAIKLALEGHNRLQIHFFHGQTGVTLVYYEDLGFKWIAYATTKQPGSPRPESPAITASDDDRGRRSEVRAGIPIEIRWRKGELILSRGDIVLLAAPLSGTPDDVVLEGRAIFHGISLVRTTDDPAPAPQRPLVFETTKPAEWPWALSKPEIAKLDRLPNGGVRLSGDNIKERIQCTAPLPRAGLHEIILELSDIAPGSGVYLVRSDAAPAPIVRFQLNKRTNQLAVHSQGWDDVAEGDFPAIHENIAPLVGAHCWVRFVYGCGNLRWWLSADGLHWAQVEPATDNMPASASALGLEVVANRPGAGLTLRRVVLRELTGLTALADNKLRQRAISVPTAASLGAWITQVNLQQPADVEPSDWRRACAVRTLSAGVPVPLAYPLLELLLDDAALRLPATAQLAALDDAMLIAWDLRDGGAMKIGLPKRYWDLGLRDYDQGGGLPWSSVRRASMSAGVMTFLGSQATPEENLRRELIACVQTRRPAEVLALCQQIRFFQHPSVPAPLLEWAEVIARRNQPGKPAGEMVARLKDGWRHPLVDELSKDAYNAMSDIQAVLDSQAWDEAARQVTGLDSESSLGLAPYPKDKQLAVSLPIAVRLMLDDYPAVRQALAARYATLGKLRIRQAMAAGDAAAVELATVQFAGADCAAEAHQWLGDRALAGGLFDQASEEYQQAMKLLPALATGLAPRMRLASALAGKDFGAAVQKDVRIGELQIPKDQFETLAAEMRDRGAGAAITGQNSRSAATPAPTGFTAQMKAKLDGLVGGEPDKEAGRRTNQFRVPWVDRQIATAVEGETLYVANRFQVAAYNLTSGARTWQSIAPPAQPALPPMRSQDWTSIPMRPLVTSGPIFARLLYGKSPTLVALNKADGKINWISEAVDNQWIVSDPILVQGQLGCLTILLLDAAEGELRWTVFDQTTGEVQNQFPLIRLRSIWTARQCAEVLPLSDSVVAALGGITLRFDPRGRVHWVRKQVVLPPEEEPRWALQMYQRPLAHGGRLYVSQPSGRAIECVEAATGRLYWSAVLPNLVGMIGLSDGKLIVQSEGDVRALDAATGKIAWRFLVDDPHSFGLCDDKQLLLARREPVIGKPNEIQTRLLWLDAATGANTASFVLPGLNDADPRLGPLVPYKDQVWTFFGRGQHDPNREVVQLIPQGEAEKPMVVSGEDIWLRQVAEVQRAAARKLFPSWQLLSGADGDRTGPIADAFGEKDVLGVRAPPTTPVAFARRVMIPNTGSPRLRVRVGNDAGQAWKLEAWFNGKLVQAVEINDTTYKDRWKQVEFDLSALRGQTGALTLQGIFLNGGDATFTFWKNIELVL